MKLAIFDFDGTIYKKETFPLMMQMLKEFDRSRFRKFYQRILPIYLGYKVKLVPEKKMKALVMEHYARALEHLDSEAVSQFFAEANREMQGDFNGEIVARIGQHRADGFVTLIVSGAFTPMLEAFAAEYPVDGIIGTNIARDFVHVHAETKVALIREKFFDETVDWNASFAYGDSGADIPVLQLVGNPVAVCPDEKLLDVALDEDWEVLNGG